MEKRWTDAITDIIGDGHTAQYHFRVQGQSMSPSLLPGDEVTVQRSSLEALHPGDLILLQNGDQPFLHRFLGVQHRDGQKWLLTGGDQKWYLDPPWPEGAFWGRASAVRRGERPLPLPTGQWYAWRLRLRAALRAVAYRLRLVLALLLPLVLLTIETGWASVTLVSFDAEWAGDQARLTWETASEVDNIGFYVLRSDQEGGEYQRVTELIPSEGDLVGSAYQWIDDSTSPGQVYYYKLEDVSASGGSTFAGPVSLPAVATATFTPTPEPTATDTPPPSPTPTFTPTPLPSSTPTLSPTDTPQPSPTASATATVPPTATSTATPTAPPAATSTAPITNTPPPTLEPSATASQPPPEPTATNMPTPSPEAALTSSPAPVTAAPLSTPAASLTPTPQPSPTLAPTATEVAMVIAPSSEGESGSAQQPDSAPPPDAVDDEDLARAKRRLTWSLIGIGGAIGGALLLTILALIIFALHQWGYLRSG